jgi:hypothetical protein
VAGELKLDETGAAGLVRELQVHAADSDEHGRQADAALAAAAGSLSSAPVADAMDRLATRFHGHADDVGKRMTSLGMALTAAANAIIATDRRLADTARGMTE